jgi:hypothetical protein
MKYPTELIAKANFEIDLFERPSLDTSKELIEEVLFLRNQFNLMMSESTKLHDRVTGQNKALAKQLVKLNDTLLEVKNLKDILEELGYRPDC